MGSRGPIPDNFNQQKLKGNPTKKSASEAKATSGKMRTKPPPYLSKEAKAIWNRILPAMKTAGIVEVVDENLFTRYCDQFARWKQVCKQMAKEPMTVEVTTKYGSNIKKNPILQIEKELSDSLGKLESSLGLSPSARARLRIEVGFGEKRETEKEKILRLINGDDD